MWRASVDGTLDRVHPIDLTGVSSRPEQCPVKGYNGSIFVGAINRRWSQLWLLLSTLGDFVSMLKSAYEPSISHTLDSDHPIV